MAPQSFVPGGRKFLLVFFVSVILAGALLLALPWSWDSPAVHPPFLDALFVSCSAVSVTGLSTVNTEQLSLFGQVVLLLLIQIGGLGIISITTLALLGGRNRLSLSRQKLVGDYYLSSLEFNPRTILWKILGYTAFFELLGCLILWPWLVQSGREGTGDPGAALFSAFFHAVSAFCNAGFSIYGDGLNQFATRPGVFLPLAGLFVCGGIGFVVIDDLRRYVSRRKPHLQLYTKLMLGATLALLLIGTLGYGLLEWNVSLAPLAYPGDPARELSLKWGNALFMSASPRTAGFDTIPPGQTGLPTQVLTMFLMFVGGGSGSTAGGLKVVTFLVLLILLVRGLDEGGDLGLGHRQISGEMVNRSMVLFVRMVGLLFLFILALALTEYSLAGQDFPLSSLAFEVFSAFSTVGLSTGITGSLSQPGKVVVILAMLAGRIGVAALAMPQLPLRKIQEIRTPREDILL